MIKAFLLSEFCVFSVVFVLNAFLFAFNKLYGVDVQKPAIAMTLILGGIGQSLIPAMISMLTNEKERDI